MRTYVAVFLLLLVSFLSQAQGIRLPKSFGLLGIPKLPDVGLMKQNSYGGDKKIEACKDGPCSGNSRKLVTAVKLTATSMSNSKCEKNVGKKANSIPKSSYEEKDVKHVKSTANSLATDLNHDVHEQYSNAMEIIEMDYSPARRKPPIHN